MKPWLGDALMWVGAAAGAFGAVLLGIGAWVHLPMALVIGIAKALPFVVALALLALGAVVRRHARRHVPGPPGALGAALPRATPPDYGAEYERERATERRP